MKHETLFAVLLIPAGLSFIWYWVQNCFKQTNEDNIKKFCDEIALKTWPKITGTQTKKFTIYLSEHRNALRNAKEEPFELALFGCNLEEELLLRAKYQQKKHPFYLINPIAVLQIKVLIKIPHLSK